MPVRIGNAVRIVRGGGFIPRPLHYTGAMAQQVLNNQYKPRATATKTRQQVRVPIPLGHAVSRQTAAEVGKLLQSEMQEMHNRAHQEVVKQLHVQGIV